MASELAADLVVMVATLYGDQHRAARVCRAWRGALVSVPRLGYDARVRTRVLDAARLWADALACRPPRGRYEGCDEARRLDRCLAGGAVVNLCREVWGTDVVPIDAEVWRRARGVPNAWGFGSSGSALRRLQPLAASQVKRLLRAALLGHVVTAPPCRSGPAPDDDPPRTQPAALSGGGATRRRRARHRG